MKVYRILKSFLMIFAAVAALSCQREIVPDPFGVATLSYDNLSDHALHLEIDQFHGMNLDTGKPFVQENVFCLDVPAHSSASKDIVMGMGHIDIYDFCSFRVTYDDGKSLTFERESREDYGSTYSPLYVKYYTTTTVDNYLIYSFEFTDELYQLAE